MNDLVEVLRGVTFLAPLPDAALKAVAEAVHEVSFGTGTRFITEGQVDDQAYVLIEGEAEVSVRGRRMRTLRRGEIVGEMAAVAARSRTASVTAVTPVRAIVLTGPFLRGLVRDHPNVAAVLAREMSSRG